MCPIEVVYPVDFSREAQLALALANMIVALDCPVELLSTYRAVMPFVVMPFEVYASRELGAQLIALTYNLGGCGSPMSLVV